MRKDFPILETHNARKVPACQFNISMIWM